ncbi:MAG: Sporulation-specific N-acetylmuramoyl-L-alanine amidase [Pelotomaculum sp. PtaB.Bin104]|nr:MAG: Sporulation-specific N-acetylmuramoyl-L-alanine amidase [Pelotomaculum sp. PtaB.Bin104]
MILVIDKGHGGTNSNGVYDPGACGNGLREADLVDDLGNRIAAKLAPYDVRIEFAPRSNSLSERAAFANNLKADFFYSLHVNSGGGTGFESYIHPDAGEETRKLRDSIHGAIVSGFLAGQGVKDRGKKEANFAVLRETNMPAVLAEYLFIDNPDDAAKLKNEAFLDGLANETAWALVQAFGLKKKIVSNPRPDICLTCSTRAERDKLYADNQRLRQIIKQAYGALADVVFN